MSSEWSSIVSTLAEDDSSNGAHKSAHKQSEGPRRYAYDQEAAQEATLNAQQGRWSIMFADWVEVLAAMFVA